LHIKKIKHFVHYTFLLLAFLSSLYAESTLDLTDLEKQFLDQHSKITVHNEKNYPPYNFNIAGKPQGLSIDYMNLLAKKLGIEIQYVSGYEWNEFIKLIQREELDVMLNIKNIPSREKFLNFTEPYASTQKAIFTNDTKYKKLKDLRNETVCVPKGFYIEHFLHSYYPEILLLRKDTTLDCIDSVIEGKSIATVGSSSIMQYIMKKSNKLLAYSYLLEDKRLTTGLSIATSSSLKPLRDIFQKAMYTISDDDLDKLSKKWIGTIEKHSDHLKKDKKKVSYEKKRVIRMCNNPNWAPIEFAKEGDMKQMSGIAIDTLKLLEKKLNVMFVNVPTESWAQSQKYLKEGKCEILPAAIATEKRKKYANFTTPYLIYKLAIITKSDKPFVNTLDDVMDKSIARKHGSGLISKLKAIEPHVNIIETKDYQESLQKVARGEAYCTIATLPVASYFINKFSLHDLHVAGYTNMRYRLSIAVDKNDSELLEILNAGLADITQKEQKNIYLKWVNRKLVETVDYTNILYIAAFILILLLLFMYRHTILKQANRTLQKEIAEKMEENVLQHQLLQEQSKMAAMGEMIGMIAHQWKQPLNALSLSIQNLEFNYEDGVVDKTFIDKFIEKNKITIDFMSRTIEDFRNFFKIDKVKEIFSIRDVIDSTLFMQSIFLDKFDILVDVEGEDFYVYGLKSELQQVILILLSNAKDILIEKVEYGRSIRIALEDNAVVFQDNGGGIPPHIIETIFDPYFTTKKEGKGTGIGLYMAKIIIEENMNGSIIALNKDGGAVFILDFKGVSQ